MPQAFQSQVLCVTVFCCVGIIECFELEGTCRGHLAQPLCNKQGHLQLDQVAQSLVQPGLECFQGWGLHYLSGQESLGPSCNVCLHS